MSRAPLFSVVDRLQAEGFQFALREGRPSVAPASKLNPEDRAFLTAHREALIFWLASPDPALEALCAGLTPEDARELREERAAILEFEAGFSRAEAEARASVELHPSQEKGAA